MTSEPTLWNRDPVGFLNTFLQWRKTNTKMASESVFKTIVILFL